MKPYPVFAFVPIILIVTLGVALSEWRATRPPGVKTLPPPVETTVGAVPVNTCFQGPDRVIFRKLAPGWGYPQQYAGHVTSPVLTYGLRQDQFPKTPPGFHWCCELGTGVLWLLEDNTWVRPVADEHTRVTVFPD